MNKKHFNISIFLIIFLFIEIFINSSSITKTIYQSSYIWFYNIVPSIFPIYLLVDLLINYQIIDVFSKLFKKFMNKFFLLKKETSFVFILSIISGFPSNSKYIKSLLDKNIINLKEANKLLMFTHFSNPLFIIESIGVSFLQNKKIGILILLVHYFSNIIIGLLTRKYYVSIDNNLIIKKHEKTSFITCLTNSIYNTLKILFLLYGIITFFMIITTILKENFSVNPLLNNFLCGLLEMTQGIYYIGSTNLSLPLKASIITFFLSFGGFSIHMQVFSILKDYKLKYFDYFLARISHALIASSIIYLILSLGNY